MTDEVVKTHFTKLNELLSKDVFIKTLFIDLIRHSIEKGDYTELIKRISSLIDVNNDESDFIIMTISNHQEIKNIKPFVSEENFLFLKMLSITYGFSLHELRGYTFSENKLLLRESLQRGSSDKISITFKRYDKEELYLELHLLQTCEFINVLLGILNDVFEKYHGYTISQELYEELLNIQDSISFIKERIESGDTNGGAKIN